MLSPRKQHSEIGLPSSNHCSLQYTLLIFRGTAPSWPHCPWYVHCEYSVGSFSDGYPILLESLTGCWYRLLVQTTNFIFLRFTNIIHLTFRDWVFLFKLFEPITIRFHKKIVSEVIFGVPWRVNKSVISTDVSSQMSLMINFLADSCNYLYCACTFFSLLIVQLINMWTWFFHNNSLAGETLRCLSEVSNIPSGLPFYAHTRRRKASGRNG